MPARTTDAAGRESTCGYPARAACTQSRYGRAVVSEVDTRWLLVSVTTAGAAPSLRMQVWRKLKGLGALYLQQSVCLLPDRPALGAALTELRERVRTDGGRMRVVHVEIADESESRELAEEMTAAIDEEYAEVLERIPSFFAELEMESGRDRAIFAEVEESEADLERFRSWAAKIEARDYFGAPRGKQVRAELGRAAAALAVFESAALEGEDAKGSPSPRDRWSESGKEQQP
ncbi:Chromate resistance protein ChrB [Streptomyces chiangmaiensis]|uniref:Chromate resistance protein ChrB n=1 Tax=Streptomyces chiangmaiensis TaxID=766497 RepID=A0ABU7FQX7_9ACTN|nr:Chromate resistance protein ChrB [Streptomyces chiangmaiensis]MED7826526.1 Chromate resistance protein ChrB [Streptomyces chiangmaiensis]